MSYVETVGWCVRFSLDAFSWSQWVLELHEVLGMPVWDLSKILDASAAWDIMYHARHWPESRARELPPLRLSPALCRMFAATGVVDGHQQLYAGRALYKHCSMYTTGMRGIAAVPVDHMSDLPVVPRVLMSSLLSACGEGVDAQQLACWLENVIVYHSGRPTTLAVSQRQVHGNSAGRRHLRRQSGRCAALEQLQADVDAALQAITACCPGCLPDMRCSVCHNASGLTIVLRASQPAPSCV